MHYKLYFCIALHVLNYVTMFASVFSLLCVTLERYVSIHHPFLYQRLWTVRKAYIAVIAAWSLPVLESLVVAAGWRNWDPNIGCHGFVMIPTSRLAWISTLDTMSVGILLTLNARIYITARHQARAIAAQMNTGRNLTSSRSGDNNKAVKLIGMVVLAYILFNMPITVNFVVCLIYRLNNWDSDAVNDAVVWTVTLRILNSCLNPFIYCTTPGVRAAARKRFPCLTIY